MKEICAECKICEFMPAQPHPRSLYHQDEAAPVLVLDDRGPSTVKGIGVAQKLMGPGIPFTYTVTIRCAYNPKRMKPGEVEIALSRCSVWTHHLTGERALILTTHLGLQQMRITREVKMGDMFRSLKWGLVLCIPPLSEMSATDIKEYTSKTQRLLAQIGLHPQGDQP